MINDFFTHPMRIFFLTAVFCVVFGCAVFFTADDFVSFHKFAFLVLVCPVAYAGFLFTAIPDWTNFPGDLKPHSITMFVIFIVALIFSPFIIRVSYALMGIFWLYLSIFTLILLFKDKNTNNFSVAAVLLGFTLSTISYAITQNELFLNIQIHINMIAIIVVSFRVSIVIAREALKLEKGMEEAVFAANFVYKNIALTALALLCGAFLLDASSEIIGFICLGVGFILMARLHEWHHALLLRHHFIVFYYIISLLASVGYLLFGFSELLGLSLSSNAVHIIAMGVIIGVIMLIFNIAGLRHSGQELVFLPLSRWAFVLIFGATLSRSILLNINEHFYIAVPALLLGLGFIFWAINFYVIFRDNEFSDDPE